MEAHSPVFELLAGQDRAHLSQDDDSPQAEGEAKGGFAPEAGPGSELEPESPRSRARRLAALPRLRLLRELDSSARGLEESEADARVLGYGENSLSDPDPPGRWRRGAAAAGDPFVLLLCAIAVIAALTGSPVGAIVVFTGAAISCALRIQQEHRGERAAAALRAMVCATATVVRRAGSAADPVAREIPVAGLVPGDVVRLVPGDLVPADLYLLAAAELEVCEWVLTGEARPAAKVPAPAVLPDAPRGVSLAASSADPAMKAPAPAVLLDASRAMTPATGLAEPAAKSPAPAVLPDAPRVVSLAAGSADPAVKAPTSAVLLDASLTASSTDMLPTVPWLCLAGGTVAHGTGTGVVIATGAATVFGAAHATPQDRRTAGGFDRAARRVTWLLLAFTAATVPLVLTLAAARGMPAPALAFALAVAVGLTPEMLPVVITTVLARAARLLAAEGTVVRRLPAVHDLAAMDTLCVDKTGTLTEGRLAVTGSVNAAGDATMAALDWALAISSAVTARAPGLTDAFDQALTEAEAELDFGATPCTDPITAPGSAATRELGLAPAPDLTLLPATVPAPSKDPTPGADSAGASSFTAGRLLTLAPAHASEADPARQPAAIPTLANNSHPAPRLAHELQVLDVLPFDPSRRRVSALLRDPSRLGSVLLATRGAVAEVLGICSDAQSSATTGVGTNSGLAASATTTHPSLPFLTTETRAPLTAHPRTPLTDEDRTRLLAYAETRAAQGDRLLAVAVGELPPRRAHAPLQSRDERGLTLVGFVVLRDRAAPEAAGAVSDLARLGVRVTVLTGDAPEVAVRICQEIGLDLDPGRIATGAQIDACDGARLAELAGRTAVFARVDPAQKARVVAALRADGRVVGFLGDGVNDAPALRAADVGIAVRGGAELARECADVVLGDKDLACLGRAITDSRRAVANAVKYLRITISSNLGNALSVALAVLILPFLPMLPLQVLVQNLCFDLCQLALARDRVDPRSAARPSRLSARDPALFALVFGLLNTIADLATFAVLHRLLHGVSSPAEHAAFYAGWFAENLLTQALAIFLLRARRQSWSARPARAVAAAGLLLAGLGLALPISRAGSLLAFAAPPAAFYPYLALIAVGYVAAVVTAKAGCRRIWPF
jgi:magnesium-transporting ATPase (P-type)